MKTLISVTTLALFVAAAAVEAAEPQLVCPGGTSRNGARPPHGRKEWCELPDGTQHGPSLSYYKDGVVKAEANFENGQLQGVFRLWHTNGQVAEQGQYDKDKRSGEFSAYGEDGTRRLRQTFVRGNRHGVVEQWHSNGQLQYAEHFKDGEKNGPAVAYYDNGQLEASGEFRNGKYHGTWSGWYENGAKRKVAVFEDGKQLSIENFTREH